MYDLTPAQRDTYLTRGRNNALIRKYNDQSYVHMFDNKDEFNEIFGEFLKRDWVLVNRENREKVLAFFAKHNRFMVKPLDGCCGKGVELVELSSYASPEAAFEALVNGDPVELEELIVQHPAVSAIYPNAINTVRTVSITKDGVPHIICTYFRIGNGGRHVDNFNSGGMVAPVDEVTGIVKDRAIDKNKTLYENHPQTGAPIKGFRFPDWDKAMDMVKQAAVRVPQVGYVGWDVAFGPEGPMLVEGNNFPGHDIYQLPEHTPDKIGMMDKFRV
jgi:glutathione synthase/RimK-type ligase-like ATP-grasp enzyme